MARMRKTTRVAFDAVLTIMLVFEMFIQYTGDFLHEVVGICTLCRKNCPLSAPLCDKPYEYGLL